MLTLHDIGKFAVTFQNLRPDLLLITQHRQTQKSADPTNRHDTSGFGLWKHILAPNLQKLGFITLGSARRATPQSQAINIWMSAVTGHHGTPPKSVNHAQVSQDFETTDQHAASAFLKDVSELLLGDSRPFPVEDGDQRDNILIKPVRFAVDRHQKTPVFQAKHAFAYADRQYTCSPPTHVSSTSMLPSVSGGTLSGSCASTTKSANLPTSRLPTS